MDHKESDMAERPTQHVASQVALVVKNLPSNGGDVPGFDPWVGKIPWRRAGQPTPVFLFFFFFSIVFIYLF